MAFLLPLAFLFAFSIPALILLYLLKVKRRPQRVSSTFLWRAAMEDARASVPFQRLRRNLLLFLQILILILLILALARPVLNLRSDQSTSLVLLVDTSASMGTIDPASGETRLELAREKAHRLIDAQSRDAEALLIAYADRAAVEVPLTSDRARLHQAVDALEVKATPDELRGGVWLAASLLGNLVSPRVVILSDSARLTPDLIDDLAAASVAIEPVGEPAPNAGWTALDLRRQSATSEAYDLFGRVVYFGAEPRSVAVTLTSEGRMLDARRVNLTPGEEAAVLAEGIAIEGAPVLQASLDFSSTGGADAGSEGAMAPPPSIDALPLDNDAWLHLTPSRDVRLLLCTPGNYFLTRMLALLENVEVVEVAPGGAVPDQSYDVAIYDRALPADPPASPALYIGLSPWSDAEAAPAEEVAAGPVTNWDPDHPVSRNVQWSTITVFGAQPVESAAGVRVLVQSGDLPLLLLGRARGQVALYLTFDLFRSNLPLRAGFPIFMKNAIDWLARDRMGREARSLRGGETFSMRVPEDFDDVTVVSPSGRRYELVPGPDRTVSFAETWELGPWRVQARGDTLQTFVVNLFNASESNPAVVDPVQISPTGEVTATGLGAELRANREIWRWVVLAALLILVLEWYLYRRVLAA